MSSFEAVHTEAGWCVALPDDGLELRGEGRVTPSGSVRAAVTVWRAGSDGEPASLLLADEGALTKAKERERLAQAMTNAAGADVPEDALLALEQAIRATPEPQRPAKALQGQAIALEDPEPWPDPVNGPELLDEIATVFERYLSLTKGVLEAVVLWAVLTFVHDAFDVSPRLAVASPTKRCGKTTLLTILQAFVRRPLPAANVTAASTFRVIEAYAPTLLIDEADMFFNKSEELLGILNAGHHRASAFVVRAVGDDNEVRLFVVWTPLAYAMIGDPRDRGTDTLGDRSIVAVMERQPTGEMERLRLDALAQLEPIRQRIARWAADHFDAVKAADPVVPDGLSDRAADNWRPLLAIADEVGGAWPERARDACHALAGGGIQDDDAGPLLLADLKAIFGERATMPTSSILEKLHEMEDRPWPEWRKGNPMSAVSLSKLLKRFGIKPKTIRTGDATPKGYRREDFERAWSRYITPADPGGDPQHPQQVRHGRTKGDSATRNTTPYVAGRETRTNAVPEGDVADVAAQKPPSARDESDDGLTKAATRELNILQAERDDDLREWATDHLDKLPAPGWWRDTIRTQPRAVAVALRLLYQHQADPHHALKAARDAVGDHS